MQIHSNRRLKYTLLEQLANIQFRWNIIFSAMSKYCIARIYYEILILWSWLHLACNHISSIHFVCVIVFKKLPISLLRANLLDLQIFLLAVNSSLHIWYVLHPLQICKQVNFCISNTFLRYVHVPHWKVCSIHTTVPVQLCYISLTQ